nr:uncharacterized protein CG45076-like [Aegilops tauschii subsp. strangulata]
METDDGGRDQSGPQLNMTLETHVAPESTSAKDAEVSELQRKLKVADDEIDRINKRFDEAQGNATEIEALKSALAEAKEEARVSKAAAEKAAADVEAEKAARLQYEARVTEVEQALQEPASKCESLEESNKAQAAELTKALQAVKEARSKSRAAREEIKQAEQIASGSPWCIYGYPDLDALSA